MDPQPRAHENVVRLIDNGVDVHAPLSVEVGDEVDATRISGDGVTIYPGCRIYGEHTVISAGCTLGAEGPVTLDDCRLGPHVALKGGSFKQSVFLEKANVGPGAQVREGCLLEEEASGAHCVGLKQTILFPFVTLGSLINFCDCLMAGGTSRNDHSEVGSSYVHFNYTPDGDKTTASLFGDVPRGVMLDQPPIFLGGQGGAVGPVRVGYGTVVAAGSVLRTDVGNDRLVFASPPESHERGYQPRSYQDLPRVVANNLAYLANLVALEHWYREVRAPFFRRQALGDLVYEGALDMLTLAKAERTKRLSAMAAKVPRSTEAAEQFATGVSRIVTLFMDAREIAEGSAFLRHIEGSWETGNYLETMQDLGPEAKAAGVQWLEEIVGRLMREAADVLPAMDLPTT